MTLNSRLQNFTLAAAGRQFFFIAFALAIVESTLAQTNIISQYQQNVTVKSPETAAFAKYVEIPVSLFNGIPDISIPLYEIVDGDIRLPISLKYHAAGIRVNEESSNVGLGWSLDAGGNISVEVRNRYDFEMAAFASTYPLPSQHYSIPFDAARYTVEQPLNCSYYLEDTTSVNYGTTVMDLDGEPDMYVYNFPGYSGKFLFKRYSETLVKSESLNGDNIWFSHDAVGTMKAVSPDGFQFSFAAAEASPVKTYLGGTQLMNTSFQLTNIKSALNRTVSLHYAPRAAIGAGTRSVSFSFEAHIGSNTPQNSSTQSNPESLAPQLDSIRFSAGTIKFIKSARQDLLNGQKIDEIRVVNNAGQIIKRYIFNYDYFQGDLMYGDRYGQFGGTVLPSYTSNFRKLRLKLVSLDEVGSDGAVLRHEFVYNNTSLPYKTSLATDYWGNFNGVNNNTLLPTGAQLMKYYRVHDWFMNYIGANREADTVKMQAGILTEIRYPTGGSIKFTYESNRFRNSINGSQVQNRGATDFNPLATSQDVVYNNPVSNEFTILAQVVKINYALTKSSSELMNCTAGPLGDCMWASIEKKNANGTWSIFESWRYQGTNVMSNILNLSLPAGTYRVQAHYPDQFVGDIRNNSYATIDVQYFVSTQDNATLKGGGLRIKRIEFNEPVTNTSWKKKYTYGESLNLNMPIMTYEDKNDQKLVMCFETRTPTQAAPVPCLVERPGKIVSLYSDTFVRYSNSANGSPVGYRFVTEEFDGAQSGKTEYVFTLRAPRDSVERLPPGIPTENILDNGLMKFRRDFKFENNMYVKVKEVENEYYLFNKKLFWGFKTVIKFPLVSCPLEQAHFQTNCKTCGMEILHFYPIRAAKAALKTSFERFYENGLTFETRKDFQYNSMGYVSSESIQNSNNIFSTKEIKYPNDYVATGWTWLNDLKSKNMMSSPLETLEKVNGKVIGGSFTKYKTTSGLTTPNELYAIETTAPKVIASTTTGTVPAEFKLKGTIEFDGSGNIKSIQPTSNTITTYVWGYSNNYQTASVVNALSTHIAYTSFETSEGTGGWSGVSASRAIGGVSGERSYTISGSITKTSLPAGKIYVVSYWSSGAAANVNNVAAQVLKSRNGWTLYRHVMAANVTSITISGSVTIDELRLYPQEAQMTTYVYEPLKGLKSSCDPNGVFTYYEYDNFNRLLTVSDDQKKIVKHYQYHYRTQQ
ncbi:hypothetical protein [Pseudochryseolinea flava]|uniref:YD repeat-containing protein n=1 Tax=Pseudochryseolinea flava TaxID=2059302 RepID=A0A364XZ54_9BACT|nr:hypothetical protein [Pseudochryseolinea flava]RAV98886.1 hypothetical protein DQQ10_21530 [Pseudochryseolinea flava]